MSERVDGSTGHYAVNLAFCVCGKRLIGDHAHLAPPAARAVARRSKREERHEDAVQPTEGVRRDAVGVATGSPNAVVDVFTASPVHGIQTVVGTVPKDVARAVARRTDPSTSWEAARSVSGIRESQAEVLYTFERVGPTTDEDAYRAHTEISKRPQSVSGFRTRRSELVRAGLLRDTGERRKGSTGRSMIVWAAA